MKGRKFTTAERAAIGELVKVATEICAVSKNEGVFVLGGVLAERAADIWRGERQPYVATLADLRMFAEAWDTKTRAKFNPKKQTRKVRRKDLEQL